MPKPPKTFFKVKLNEQSTEFLQLLFILCCGGMGILLLALLRLVLKKYGN